MAKFKKEDVSAADSPFPPAVFNGPAKVGPLRVCIECREPMVGDEPEGATICSLCNEAMEMEAAIHEEELSESYKYMENHPEEGL